MPTPLIDDTDEAQEINETNHEPILEEKPEEVIEKEKKRRKGKGTDIFK